MRGHERNLKKHLKIVQWPLFTKPLRFCNLLDSAFSLSEGTGIVEGVTVAAEEEEFFLGTEVVITVCAILGGPSMKSLSQTFETRESQKEEKRTEIWLRSQG